MGKQDQGTQERLLEVAAKIFYEKGFHGARMQEIASQAGLNKAMLHYYFTNKEQLFDAVFAQAFQVLMPSLMRFFTSDGPLRDKVGQVIDDYTSLLQEHPHVPVFILSELRMHPDKVAAFSQSAPFQTDKLEAQIEAEVTQGNLRPISPKHFLLILFSSCIFPHVSSIIWQGLMGLSPGEYNQLLEGRKQALLDLFWNSLQP